MASDSTDNKLHCDVMRLFREQSIMISKSGSEVCVQCKSSDDANTVFEWLASITGKYATVDEWLDEIESFSMRRERLDDPKLMEPWIRAAFDAGSGCESIDDMKHCHQSQSQNDASPGVLTPRCKYSYLEKNLYPKWLKVQLEAIHGREDLWPEGLKKSFTSISSWFK
jgi:hypothetical protein